MAQANQKDSPASVRTIPATTLQPVLDRLEEEVAAVTQFIDDLHDRMQNMERWRWELVEQMAQLRQLVDPVPTPPEKLSELMGRIMAHAGYQMAVPKGSGNQGQRVFVLQLKLPQLLWLPRGEDEVPQANDVGDFLVASKATLTEDRSRQILFVVGKPSGVAYFQLLAPTAFHACYTVETRKRGLRAKVLSESGENFWSKIDPANVYGWKKFRHTGPGE